MYSCHITYETNVFIIPSNRCAFLYPAMMLCTVGCRNVVSCLHRPQLSIFDLWYIAAVMASFEYVIGKCLIDWYALSNQLKTFRVAIGSPWVRFLQTTHILSENDVDESQLCNQYTDFSWANHTCGWVRNEKWGRLSFPTSKGIPFDFGLNHSKMWPKSRTVRFAQEKKVRFAPE